MEHNAVEQNADNPLTRWAAVADELGQSAELPPLTNALAGAFIDEVQALANANAGLPPMGLLVPALQRIAVGLDHLATETAEADLHGGHYALRVRSLGAYLRHVAVGIASVTLVAGHHARAAAELEKL